MDHPTAIDEELKTWNGSSEMGSVLSSQPTRGGSLHVVRPVNKVNLPAFVFCFFSDAAFKILNPKTVPRFFRLNSHNAILEFLLEGTPEIKEHYIDSKKEVDRHLKSSCEHFIQQQTKLFVGKLEDLLTKVAALKTMASQGGPKYNLSQQPWAQPAKINDIVATTYKTLKTKLPATLQSMSLYLANKDTEFILFKPVRNNIQQVFQKLHAMLQEEYSVEDLQIIACPSVEQINLLLSVNK